MEGLKVHSVSFAEFDVDVGNTLTHKYPQFKLEEFDDEYLANCCLPDGGHIHSEDRTYHILPIKITQKKQKSAKKLTKKKLKKDETVDPEDIEPESELQSPRSSPSSPSLSPSTSPDHPEDEERILYGVGYFRNRPDKTVKRGALQKAILVLTWQPFFEIYSAPALATLERYLDDHKNGCKNGKALLKNFYESIQNLRSQGNLQLHLHDQVYPLNVPKVEEDEFEGVSLINLVKIFQIDTIILWYLLLLQKRVLFCGQPAKVIGNSCLAAPLLVAPLKGFTKITTPYVALTEISPVMKPTYICGSTNVLFETKTDWWDGLASLITGTVVSTCGIKISSSDRSFMKTVISGINDNKVEKWVRQQFYLHTYEFLISVEQDKMRKDLRKYFSNFRDTKLYKRYKTMLAKQEVSSSRKEDSGPIATFRQLHQCMESQDGNAMQKTKLLFALSKNLEDISAIEEVCDHDGVAVIASTLNEINSQTRKYAVVVLAQLALSLKGQIAMLSDQVLPRVVEMLKDPMPNVVSAACYCLFRISELYIGVQILVERDLTQQITELLYNSEKNLDVKTLCVATLLQIYRYAPEVPVPQGLKKYLLGQLKTPDKDYRSKVLQLFDLWGEELPKVSLSPKMKSHIQMLQEVITAEDGTQGPDCETRITATTYLLSDLVTMPELLLEFVDGGGVEVLIENIKLTSHLRLLRYTYQLLSMIADSNFGRKKILRYRFIETILQELEQENTKPGTMDPLLIFSLTRFLEVCTQHEETITFIKECNGLEHLFKFLASHWNRSDASSALLCIPALGAVRLLVFFDPEFRDKVLESEKNIQLLADIIAYVGTDDEKQLLADQEITQQDPRDIASSILSIIQNDRSNPDEQLSLSSPSSRSSLMVTREEKEKENAAEAEASLEKK